MRPTTTHPTPPTWRKAACVLVLGLAALTGGVEAQQSTPGSPAPPPPATLGVAEVAVQVEQVAADLRDLEARAAPPPEVLAIERKLDTEGQAMRQNLAAARAALAKQPTLQDLRDMEGVWSERARRLGAWNATLARRGRAVEEQIARAQALEAEWKGIAAGLGGAPEQLRQRVAALIEEIGATENRLDERRDTEVLSESRVAQLTVEVGELLADVERAQGATFRRLLVRESPTFWGALALAGSGPPLGEQLRSAVAAQMNQLRAWLDERSDYLPVAFVLLVAVLTLTFVLRRRVQRWAAPDAELQTAVTLVRPISVAFVVWLFLTPLPYVGGLPPVRAVLLLALAVALLRLLPLLLPRERAGVVYVLLAFIVVDGIRGLTEPLILVDRVLFTAEVGGAIAILWWARGWADRDGVELAATARALRAAVRVALAGLGVALLADVLGYMSLAHLLGDGIVRSAYVTVVIYVLGRIADELVVALLRTGFLRSLRVVRKRVAALERIARRIVSLAVVVAWTVVVLRLLSILDPVWSAVNAILTARLAFGEFSLSLGDLLVFAFTVWASFVLSGVVRAVLDDEVLPRFTLRRGVPYAVSTISGYAVLMFGFFAALAAAGVPFGRLAIVMGGLGVGVGFGLQNIVNNLVSGTILLFERPIQIGDTIQMQALHGRVKRIGLRSSTIESPDGAEVIVPNADLISGQLVNWTLSDRRRRIDIPVGVAYGTDPERVLALLVDAAGGHRGVLRDPPPSALFIGFGQSSLDFSLRAWTDEDQEFPQVRSEIAVAVYRALTDAGIEIPFPQQDVHVKSAAPDVVGLAKPTGEDEAPALARPQPDKQNWR